MHTTHLRSLFTLLLLLAALTLASSCNKPEDVTTGPGDETTENSTPGTEATPAAAAAPSVCPAMVDAPAALPNVRPEHNQLEYWLTRTAEVADLDAELLSPLDVRNHNVAHADKGTDLGAPIDVAELRAKLDERFVWLLERFESKAYIVADGTPLPADARALLNTAHLPDTLQPTLRVALDNVPFRCAPTGTSYYTPSLDLRFDRNNCSTAHRQELVQIVAPWPNGELLARTRYTYGWIAADASLSPALSESEVTTYLASTRASLVGDQNVSLASGGAVSLPDGTLLPLVEDAPNTLTVATADGIQTSAVLAESTMRPTTRPLTRRALLEEAFRYLDTPYGWGGADGGRDCSRFLMDVFAGFGIELPRHSATMAQAGTFSIDLSGVKTERERLNLIDAAAERGAVLLHFPGHIMMYLGRDAEGIPMAIHSFAEYVTPCAETDPAFPDAVETIHALKRITVSDLELGRGSSRTAFIQRITRVTVIGEGPGNALMGAAEMRPAAPVEKPSGKCKDSDEIAIFVSPRVANAKEPMRVIVTTSHDLFPVGLTLIDPDGNHVTPEVRSFGGPPYGEVAVINKPKAGKWRALYGDGSRVDACLSFRVRGAPATESVSSEYVWKTRRNWSRSTENLYATWVEALFDYPIDEDVSWKNLHSVTRNAERNILFDHLGLEEDSKLKMKPDCADLPYMLRAYFAWKLGLPYGYRKCDRGRAGRAPRCNDVNTNVSEREKGDDLGSFSYFANRRIRNGVHSASGRTPPESNDTDFYPVELTREAIPPGTLFADPYGHLLVVADWVPQKIDNYGVLIAVDAQPDGTVGRRRFWRGSFLFTPETTDVGAGFKAFRPVVVNRSNAEVTTMTNEELADHEDFAKYSRQQYEVTKDGFYMAVEGLINPRPLDPLAMQMALVDAMNEAATRRVLSVQNGEDYKAAHPGKTIEMPTGYSVFETSGPWEDFSTPARDMRLLISIDTVTGFPAVVRQAPERFGILPGDDLDAAVAKIENMLDTELRARSLTYVRSDGESQTLTLRDVVDRKLEFEMSYHPNDCAEIRWAAPADSEEMKSCKGHAPKAARDRMKKYRPWFAERRRPPR